VEADKEGDVSLDYYSFLASLRLAISYSNKAEALAENLETQFQPVNDP
jgi:hypothetical protein